MCRPSLESSKETRTLFRRVWPIPPAVVAVAFAILFPTTDCFLNRGYTVWFHWVVVAYVLTQSTFLRKFAILQGTAITLGWYAAIVNDYCLHGKFCHTLYRNMPESMMSIMLDQQGQLRMNSYRSLAMMVFSHILDTLGHPFLPLLFWWLHRRAGGTLGDILSWRIILSCFAVSRVWSLVHTTYNFGSPNLWYFGYDVYVIDDLDSWMSAYVTEGVVFACAILWRLLCEEKHQSSPPRTKKLKGDDTTIETKPMLAYSYSGVSISSSS